MIVGIGTDLLDIERVEQLYARFKDALARKILAEAEWPLYVQSQAKGRFLAKRFAMKEALAKALGTGMREGVRFRDFQITHSALGKPECIFLGKADQLAKQNAIKRIHLSMSDEQSQVLAFAILES